MVCSLENRREREKGKEEENCLVEEERNQVSQKEVIWGWGFFESWRMNNGAKMGKEKHLVGMENVLEGCRPECGRRRN